MNQLNDNQNLPASEDPWAAATTTTPTDSQGETAHSTAEASSAPASAANDDPWAASSSPAESGSEDPWGAGASTDTPATNSNSWLDAPAASTSGDADAGGLSGLWHQITTEGLPIQGWINDGLGWVVDNFRPFFQAVRTPIDTTLSGVTDMLLAIPWPLLIIAVALIAWQFAGRGLAIGSAISLLAVVVLGIWPEAMVTLALVLTSLLFCVIIGLPTGILLASSDRAQRLMRPLLDAMQTTPAFVYLVPVVMLFGIGNVPGVIVTIVFALPPLIRLTNLGIRQVRPDLIEASRAYGASPWQLLWKVQLPLAMPSIMTGINQALMLSLSMVVIASMIAVGGLGQMVLRGIGRLDMGLATVGGLGIVLLAIVLDRITQSMGERQRGAVRWWHTGPIGFVARALGKVPAGNQPSSH